MLHEFPVGWAIRPPRRNWLSCSNGDSFTREEGPHHTPQAAFGQAATIPMANQEVEALNAAFFTFSLPHPPIPTHTRMRAQALTRRTHIHSPYINIQYRKMLCEISSMTSCSSPEWLPTVKEKGIVTSMYLQWMGVMNQMPRRVRWTLYVKHGAMIIVTSQDYVGS